MIRQFITSKREGQELNLKANPPELLPQRVIVENSPGPLPGTNIDMSQTAVGQNGYEHRTNGHTLDLEKNAESPLPAPDANDQIIEPEPQPQAQGHDPSSAT